MITIRKAQRTDISAIREMAYITWPKAYETILSPAQLDYMLDMFYAPDSIARQMDQLNHVFYIAEDDHKIPVGFASFSAAPNNKKHFHLHKLYVVPDRQKSHAGRHLAERVIREVAYLGGESLQLNVNRHNPALGFYKKLGFAIIREEDNDIGRGYFMNDYVMEKKIRI